MTNPDSQEAPKPPPPGWLIWTVAGVLGGGGAGAAVAGLVPTQLGPMAAEPGLPLWVWSGINGALVGAQGGPLCLLWQRVRRGELGMFWGMALIPFMVAAILTVAFCLTTSIASFATGQPALLPSAGTLPVVFWGNLAIGCGLFGALMGHVSSPELWIKLPGAWFMTVFMFMPLGALGIMVHGREPGPDFFYRAGFPYYLALPLAWWVASLLVADPLPPESEEEA